MENDKVARKSSDREW